MAGEGFGSEAVVIWRGSATVIDKGSVADICGLPESVTCTVKSEVPAAVGTPLITPLEALRLQPGRQAAARHRPGVGAETARGDERLAVGAAGEPAGQRRGADVSGLTTVRVIVSVPVWPGLPESVTVTVKWYVPLCVGVPLIVPLEASRLQPRWQPSRREERCTAPPLRWAS